jgi:hypothetical protein
MKINRGSESNHCMIITPTDKIMWDDNPILIIPKNAYPTKTGLYWDNRKITKITIKMGL